MRHFFNTAVPAPLWLGGYADSNSIRLFNEHRKDRTQYRHYADDWDEEDDSNGWRCWR